MKKAKRVIDSEYALVGIYERLQKTVALMEKTMPQFYRGFKNFVAKLNSKGTDWLPIDSHDKVYDVLM